MNKPLPPFSCTHSPNLPELLNQLNCTLAISTYQAGKVIMISAINNNNIMQLPRNFQKSMGMAFNGNKMAVGTQFTTHELSIMLDLEIFGDHFLSERYF